MKHLAIVSIVLAALGLGIGAYHLAETHPNEKAFRARSLSSPLARKLWKSYEAASDKQGIAMGVLAIAGFLTGLLGWLKTRSKPALIGIVLSLGLALIPLATKTHMFS